MFLVVLCTTLYELTRAGYLGKNGFLGWYFASLVATGTYPSFLLFIRLLTSFSVLFSSRFSILLLLSPLSPSPLLPGWIQYTIPSTRRYLFFVLVLMYLAVNRWLSKQLPQRPDAKHDHIKVGRGRWRGVSERKERREGESEGKECERRREGDGAIETGEDEAER